MKSESEFINYHLNRIIKIQTSMNNKRIFVECFPTDADAICFPNSNLAVKEIFFDADESSSAEEAIGELLYALEGLVNDVKNKPNDTRYAAHIKNSESVIAKYKQSKK